MEMQLYCPHCQEVVHVQPELAGQTTHCHKCGGEFRVPGPEGVAAGPAASARPITPDEQLRKSVTTARIACGLLALFSMGFGLHKFALGRVVEGLIMLVITLLSCFFLWPVILVIGWVEGVIYLLLDDDEFRERYIVGSRGWF